MRVLITGINFYPEATGTGKYTSELAVYLAAQKHDVRVISAHPYYPQWKILQGYHAWQYKHESWEGVEIYHCPLWVPRYPGGVSRLIHLGSFALSSFPVLLKQISWKPDVILCIAPTIMNAPFVLATAKLSGAKTWLHIQDFELDAAVKLGLLPGGKQLASLAGWLEHSILDGFQHISTISNRMLVHLHEKHIPSEKTSLLPNWVDTNAIFPIGDSPNPLRDQFGLKKDQVVILYAGNMGKKQGLEQLVDSARQLQALPEIQFILCGDGAVRSDLEESAKDLTNIRFLPVQPFEKLNQLLNMADIHIILQKADAADLVMPSKLSGILASGKPVIATSLPDTELGQIVGQVGFRIPPDDLPALVYAIKSLAGSPIDRTKAGKKGRDYAIKNWDSGLVLGRFQENLDYLVNSAFRP